MTNKQPLSRRVRVTPELVERFVADYANGQGSIEIATTHGVTVPTVIRWLRERGVVIRRVGTYAPKAQAATAARHASLRPVVLADYRAGTPLKTLATRHHLDHKLISGWVAQTGIDPARHAAERRSMFDEAQVAQLARRFQAGASFVELAEEYGVSDKTVGRAVKRHLGITESLRFRRPSGRAARQR